MIAEAVPAVVLAAGGKADKLAAAENVSDKALLDIAGRPMIDWVLDALSAATRISSVTVVADSGSPLQSYLGDRASVVSPEGPTFLGSLAGGLAACRAERRVLVCTGDIPLVQSQHIDDYLARCDVYPDAELCYSIIRADQCEKQFPGGRRTTVRLREGRFTGGNAVTIAPAFLTREQQRISEVFAARKSPRKLAGMFGWGLLLRTVLGLASLPAIVARAKAMLNCDVAAVETPHAALGFDVDKPEDLQLVRSHLIRI